MYTLHREHRLSCFPYLSSQQKVYSVVTLLIIVIKGSVGIRDKYVTYLYKGHIYRGISYKRGGVLFNTALLCG